MVKKFKNPEQLKEYANTLNNKKVREFNKTEIKGKGSVGLIIEEMFGIKPNNIEGPDFEELGIELKVAPLKKVRGELKAKERVSLSMLDLDDLIENDDIRNSKKWNKIRKILMIWYLHNSIKTESKVIDNELIEIENTKFFKQISKDWRKLHKYAREGRAHEFSESLTEYLGLARKGQKNDKPKKQKLNPENPYYPRAFTFKQKLLNEMISDSNIFEGDVSFIEILKEKFLNKKFKDFLDVNSTSKSILPNSIAKEFGVSSLKKLSEYVENEFGQKYTFKTFPVKRKVNGELVKKEEMKFNIQPWTNIGLQWHESEFSSMFENPFVFIIYEHNDNIKERKIIDIKEVVFNDDIIVSTIEAFYEYTNLFEKDLLKNYPNINIRSASDKKTTHLRPWAKNGKSMLIEINGKKAAKLGIWINGKDLMKILGYKK